LSPVDTALSELETDVLTIINERNELRPMILAQYLETPIGHIIKALAQLRERGLIPEEEELDT